MIPRHAGLLVLSLCILSFYGCGGGGGGGGSSTPANVSPTAVLTAPVNGTSATNPATVSLTATAADSDGTVTKVEFFDGLTKLGEDIDGSNGWSYTWSTPTTGSHVLSAHAVDNQGAIGSSSPITYGVSSGANLITVNSVQFDNDLSRTLTFNNSNFPTAATYALTGTGSWGGTSLTFSFSNVVTAGVNAVRLSLAYSGGGPTETYDLAISTSGAIYNLQTAGRVDGMGNPSTDNWVASNGGQTPRIFLPATITSGATWTGGFANISMSIVSSSATSPGGVPQCIQVRETIGMVTKDWWLKPGAGYVEIVQGVNGASRPWMPSSSG